MINTTLCYLERGEEYPMLHRTKKENDLNHDKWIGVGGKFQDKESPEDCLLRETWEELGIPESAVTGIGEMDFIHIRAGSLLRPVLGEVDPATLAGMRPAPEGVADAFLLPRRELKAHPPEVYLYRQRVEVSV